MTERMERRLLDLKARQQAGEHMPCPRCGADTMKEPIHTNALSRATDLYVCGACGSVEAMLAFMKQEYPLTSWAAFQPVRPPSDLGALPAAEVLQRVLKEQVNTLIHLYRMCRDDPKNGSEYRSEAFESCPGLTELWTQPFYAKYQAADGAVILMFKTGADGRVQIAECVIDKQARKDLKASGNLPGAFFVVQRPFLPCLRRARRWRTCGQSRRGRSLPRP